ncbi:hypothetical protein [Thalassospira sp.]|uniref:hypothetical protein n=1 Tax=Thalassospira sp. TaxID=1912094 RepID=UPI001B205E9E|nr:hypothetical protein [Thalassospira sp.]MBO6808976.1 hypothetical protein [Thalassospira sp.]MBO6841998.1 hypothetical protein [Thalassospira sp.]
MIKKIIVLAAAAMLAGCATAANKFQTEMPIGATVTKKLTVPQGDILLPNGDWTVVGTSITRNNHYQAFGHIALARIDDDKNLNGIVFLMTALETPLGFSFFSSEECKPDSRDIYFEKSADYHLGTQLCFYVDRWSMYPTANQQDGVFLQANEYIKQNGIERPSNMLFSVHRIVRRNKFLIAEYGFDFYEPVPVAFPDYEPTDTSVTKEVYSNPRWQKNLDNVIAWSREYHPKIAAEFLD